MEINIYKDNGNVKFCVGTEQYIMNFDNLVILSELILKNKDEPINVKSEGQLELYKNTIEKLRDSLIKDKQLIDLLKEKEKE